MTPRCSVQFVLRFHAGGARPDVFEKHMLDQRAASGPLQARPTSTFTAGIDSTSGITNRSHVLVRQDLGH